MIEKHGLLQPKTETVQELDISILLLEHQDLAWVLDDISIRLYSMKDKLEFETLLPVKEIKAERDCFYYLYKLKS